MHDTCEYPQCRHVLPSCASRTSPCKIEHDAFDGEGLTLERAWANRPFFATPLESFGIVAVTLAALVAVGVML